MNIHTLLFIASTTIASVNALAQSAQVKVDGGRTTDDSEWGIKFGVSVPGQNGMGAIGGVYPPGYVGIPPAAGGGSEHPMFLNGMGVLGGAGFFEGTAACNNREQTSAAMALYAMYQGGKIAHYRNQFDLIKSKLETTYEVLRAKNVNFQDGVIFSTKPIELNSRIYMPSAEQKKDTEVVGLIKQADSMEIEVAKLISRIEETELSIASAKKVCPTAMTSEGPVSERPHNAFRKSDKSKLN